MKKKVIEPHKLYSDNKYVEKLLDTQRREQDLLYETSPFGRSVNTGDNYFCPTCHQKVTRDKYYSIT